MPIDTLRRRLYANNNTAEVICQLILYKLRPNSLGGGGYMPFPYELRPKWNNNKNKNNKNAVSRSDLP